MVAEVSVMLRRPSAHELPVVRSWRCLAKRRSPGPPLVSLRAARPTFLPLRDPVKQGQKAFQGEFPIYD
jgi:hypothetical protein